MQKITFSLLFLLATTFIVSAQNPGDTTVVQAFTFESTTRDSVIQFPDFNATDVERIWMKYTMRCKDGLVSPPISGQTNNGCGEWDYSCNTSVYDSTRIDSVKAQVDQYTVYHYPSFNDVYSIDPTYEIYDAQQNELTVIVDASYPNPYSEYSVNNNGDVNLKALSNHSNGSRSFILIKSQDILNSGLSNGSIDGFSFSSLVAGALDDFQVKIQEVNLSTLSGVNISDLEGGVEVYRDNYSVLSGTNNIYFYQPFNYSGGDLLLELVSKGSGVLNDLDIVGSLTSDVQVLTSENNAYLRMYETGFINVDNYTGIAGNGARTIEAWIKTTGGDQVIAAWGENSTGMKFEFRLNGAGNLRVEINGGYTVGSTVINDDQWHHVAMTFDGNTLNDVDFYVDGQLETISQISSIAMNTGTATDVRISNGFHSRYINGGIDDIRIWSSALSQAVINAHKDIRVDSNHPNYTDLELNYTFDEMTQNIVDKSAHMRDGSLTNDAVYGNRKTWQHGFDFTATNAVLDISLIHINGGMIVQNNTVAYADSIEKEPYIVIENSWVPQYGTFNSDITKTIAYYWNENSTNYDANGVFVSDVQSSNIITLAPNTLDYYTRTPSKIELLSFVTPYGINLDLGIEGKAWYFDVTDYFPILKGSKELLMDRGGQWQEDIDIQFLFVHGTPTREVLDLRQIWRVDYKGYAQIQANDFFEPRTVDFIAGTQEAKIRTAVTGHGQEGEFIPRTHFVNINSGQQINQWQVWKECSENPVFPQGGTWIYDRAGWCPGMPTDVQEFDVTNYISNNQIDVDYGLMTASGTSNYIVNNQIVSYGSPNFTLDARIKEVVAPNKDIVNGRLNPICDEPVVTIQNNGTSDVQSVELSYSINGGTPETYTWTGTLGFLEEVQVALPVSATFWTGALSGQDNDFDVNIVSVNGTTDEYQLNDTYQSRFVITNVFEPVFKFRFKTNNAASENDYRIVDADGNIILERTVLSNNTSYVDTLMLSQGCYKLEVIDTDDDGINFWANNDGSGYMQFQAMNGLSFKTLESDFGGDFVFEFTVTAGLGIESLTKYNPTIELAPNPAEDVLNIEVKGLQEGSFTIRDINGKEIMTGDIQQLLINGSINVSNWENGVYFVEVYHGDSRSTKKFVKM